MAVVESFMVFSCIKSGGSVKLLFASVCQLAATVFLAALANVIRRLICYPTEYKVQALE